MQVTFGIDVSKSTSTVCELIGESKNELTITNNRPGFIQLLHELTAFSKHPQIIFEATGVYSRRLQAFLEDYGYEYVVLNPLKAKKEMDMGLRHNKTDKTDAYHLALIQRLYHHPINQLQSQTYKQLNSLSRFYNQLTADLVMAKNRLHQALQSTFPEIENLFSAAKGKNYWQIVNHYPHCDLVRKADKKQIITWLTNLKGIAFRHAQRTADKLIKLAHQAYPVVSCSSIEVEQVQYYAHRLLNLSDQRENLIARMVKLAKSLPNYDLENLESIPGFAQTTAVRVLAELGDLRRF
ncbi:IS110 family transposase, partial [Lactobacillus sp. A27]|uniref:IS110 family transposase n=1 Tax=Lactobacillus sp. A27 TaxID=2796363 RepID=UPI00191FDD31